MLIFNWQANIGSHKHNLLECVHLFTAADAFRHDGIYSKYFINMTTARYSLKVTVKNQDGARISRHRHSGAPYVPGYVVNGKEWKNTINHYSEHMHFKTNPDI